VRCVLLLSFVLVQSSCSAPGLDPRSGEPCFSQNHCSADANSLRACIDNSCQEVECLSSADCGLGAVCDLEDNRNECVAGCQGNYDCPPGSNCLDGLCQEYGCRTTVLDCAFGEICNPETKQCELAEGPFCQPGCDPLENVFDDRGTDDLCDDVALSNPSCGEGASSCWWAIGETVEDTRCYVHCETTGDCPAGFQCVVVRPPFPECDAGLGEVTLCLADCP
jgi:hypothetical protein